MKVTAGVTQTYSHCGYRDQNPGWDLVPDARIHADCEGVVLKSTVVPERKIGQDKWEECFRVPSGKMLLCGTVMLLKCLWFQVRSLSQARKIQSESSEWLQLSIGPWYLINCSFVCLHVHVLNLVVGFGLLFVHLCQLVYTIPKAKHFPPFMIMRELTEAT